MTSFRDAPFARTRNPEVYHSPPDSGFAGFARAPQ
jgi:hypothetical protein